MLPTCSLKFKYTPFPATRSEAFPNRISALRPVINIRLLFDNKSVKYPVLLDSGADFCIFHAEIGEGILGIPVKTGKKLVFFGTGGAPQEAYFHTIAIDLGGYDFQLYCGFSYEMKTLPYGILGQVGFFDLFKVEFDYKGKQIVFKPKH
jgi:hypothetical protein